MAGWFFENRGGFFAFRKPCSWVSAKILRDLSEIRIHGDQSKPAAQPIGNAGAGQGARFRALTLPATRPSLEDPHSHSHGPRNIRFHLTPFYEAITPALRVDDRGFLPAVPRRE